MLLLLRIWSLLLLLRFLLLLGFLVPARALFRGLGGFGIIVLSISGALLVFLFRGERSSRSISIGRRIAESITAWRDEPSAQNAQRYTV